MIDAIGEIRSPSAVRAEVRPAILLADDDGRNLYSLREALVGLDVDVVCAESGREVLQHVLRRDFAVILLDARMPDVDGYETALLIRKREKSQHIPIIFLTALDKEITHIFRGYSAGAVDYVFKPVDPFILRAKVSIFLDLHGQAQKIRQQMIHTRELLEENISTRKANEMYLARLQHLSHQLMALQDAERRSLAREMHDEIGQCLAALNLNLQTLTKFIDPSETRHSLLRDSLEIVNNLVHQVRNISLAMHPTMLDDFGLEETLRWYVDHLRERTDLMFDSHFGLGVVDMTSEQRTACYRIAQSALTNALRHAKATRVSIDLRLSENNELLLSIADNGIGFDQERVWKMIQRGRSFGLIAMRERSILIGGHLEIESAEERGTVVSLRLPLRKTKKGRSRNVSVDTLPAFADRDPVLR